MKIRTPLTITLAIGLLASSTIGVVAQDEAADPMAPAYFSHDFGDGTTVDIGNVELKTWPDVKASDPRAEGVLTMAQVKYFIEGDGFDVTVFPQTMRLVNAGGAWTGTGEQAFAFIPDKQKPGKKPKKNAPISGKTFVHQTWKLTGEGDYEGLLLELYLSLHQNDRKGMLSVKGWGIIVPTDLVVAHPEIPSVAAASQ